MKFDIVIAGGGFAGAHCARVLGRLLGREAGERRVALVAERNVLVFQPMLAEVAGATLAPRDIVNPLRQYCRGVTVLQGAIQGVDWAARELVLDGGRFTRNHRIAFSHLVLAMGSVTDLSAVPGMSEYGWPMKNVADALRLRSALVNRLEEANLVEDAAVRQRLLTFAVVGGGYTGVETAGQLFDFCVQAKRFYSNLRGSRIQLVLLHGGAELLAEIGPELGAYARSVLEKRGIDVRLNAKVASVTAHRVFLADGTSIEANTVVTSIGNAPNPVVVDLCRQVGVEAVKGRVPTDAFFKVGGCEGLWAAGDCAAVPWEDRGKVRTSPATAQFAQRHGELLGENLMRALHGAPSRPFRYRYMGQMAAIGDRVAVAEILGFRFRGFLAWWMWRTVYLSKLPGVARKLRVMLDWSFDLLFPRDISVLQPPPDDTVRSIHLEKGETLFERGHICRGFAFVRHGAVILSGDGSADRKMAAGDLLDQNQIDDKGAWRFTATAAEPTDIILFRGRMLDLLRGDLRLTRRPS